MAQHISVWLVRAYQRALSPALAALAGPLGRCRFEPSCSQYAIEAVQTHGTVKGIGLAAWRICRCAPWGGCGHDPVPPVKLKVQSSKFKASKIQAQNILRAGRGRISVFSSPKGAKHSSPGQSEASPWVDRSTIKKALKGRADHTLDYTALAGLGPYSDFTQGVASLCPGLEYGGLSDWVAATCKKLKCGRRAHGADAISGGRT